MKRSLERIDYKIDVFEKRIVAAEKTLKKPEN